MTDTLDTLDLPRIDRVAAAATHARYHIEPLPGGYGTTLGAALRRVLLSALPGAAIVALRVDGLLPGATALPGVREDLAELLLALRRVRLRYDGAGPVDLTLDISAPGEVTAGLLVAPPDAGVEIVTPAAYLLTLDPGAELHATLTVARGTGYATAPPHDNDTPAPVAALPVDALFSPIRRVSYTVERARVGPLTTYDRLVLDIETDGILTPDQALHLAAAGLVDHFARVATHGRGRTPAGRRARAAALVVGGRRHPARHPRPLHARLQRAPPRRPAHRRRRARPEHRRPAHRARLRAHVGAGVTRRPRARGRPHRQPSRRPVRRPEGGRGRGVGRAMHRGRRATGRA